MILLSNLFINGSIYILKEKNFHFQTINGNCNDNNNNNDKKRRIKRKAPKIIILNEYNSNYIKLDIKRKNSSLSLSKKKIK